MPVMPVASEPQTSEAMPESAQGSLSFNAGPEMSASTAPFVSAGTVPLSGNAEHLDRFLSEAANPMLATPTSERPTTASDLGTRRALLFSNGQGSATPVNADAQGTPGTGVAGASIAPSQASCSSTEYRQLLQLKEQQLLQYNQKLQAQEAELKKYQDKQLQMEVLLQQLQRQVQQAAVIHIQPSITTGRINPQPAVLPHTPTTVEQPGMTQPAQAAGNESVPVSHTHVSLPQHIAVTRNLSTSIGPEVTPAVSHGLNGSVPSVPAVIRTAPVYPVSYAAVVQPVLSQPAVHVNSHPVNSTTLPAGSRPQCVSAVDLVSDQQSEGPSVTLQDMPASDFLQQFVQACKQPCFGKSLDQKTRFKMDSGDRVKGVSLRKGERLTSALVLQWVATARVLDSAALKARNREPETPSEWATFFKFYVDHMEDGLHEVLMATISNGRITSVCDFWNAVFRELFPEALVQDAFEEALKDYTIWAEPLGLERWEKVTKLLVQYKEMVAGNTGPSLDLAISERMYQQLLRVIHLCKERQSQDLLRQLALYQVPLNLARAAGRKPSAEEYTQTYRAFLLWLIDWLKLYSYEGTFGYPMAVATGSHSHSDSSSKRHLRQMGTPTTPVQREATPKKPPYIKTKLPQLAPTGKLRTWTWKQRTCPDNAPREECASPAPTEAQEKGCEFLGDWLDLQGLCTYCTKPGHVKEHCPKHKANKAKWEAAQKKAQEATVQEN